jgi:hypothetical protein
VSENVEREIAQFLEPRIVVALEDDGRPYFGGAGEAVAPTVKRLVEQAYQQGRSDAVMRARLGETTPDWNALLRGEESR